MHEKKIRLGFLSIRTPRNYAILFRGRRGVPFCVIITKEFSNFVVVQIPNIKSITGAFVL